MGKVLEENLLEWYYNNKRDLPWKNTNDPYKIWLSEIILQQTRVVQGTPYYLKFVEAFPTVYDLANAPLDEVLKLWEGLGYYSRARNLHAAAKMVVEDMDGVFPKNYETLLNLKGVGAYTAAAIASFAYNEAVAVVDGNVFRVLARIFGIHEPIDMPSGKKLFKEIAQRELNIEKPADYNQAIMNFGALVCLPKNPKCGDCPFQSNCNAFKNQTISLLPIKAKKLKKKNRFFNYFIMYDDHHIIIQQRKEKDIWKELYQFPLIETEQQLLKKNEFSSLENEHWQPPIDQVEKVQLTKVFSQVLTHQNIKAKFILMAFNDIEFMELQQNWTLIKKGDINQYAFPKIINSFLAEAKFIIG